MTRTLDRLADLSEVILAAPRKSQRRLVALAGAPGSGKSTLAQNLADDLHSRGANASVVPMDGFHLDNRLLEAMGLLDRKGAPETFDAQGFGRLVAALGQGKTLYYPLFDRSRDIAIAGAGVLDETCDTVILEGNYLLLDAPHWRDLTGFWDIRIRLSVDEATLCQRLTDRWLAHGLSPEQAVARAQSNDIPNAHRIAAQSLPCDILFDSAGKPD